MTELLRKRITISCISVSPGGNVLSILKQFEFHMFIPTAV